MKQEPSVKKNFIYSTIYQILNVIIPFVTAPYIARVLGADGNGIQSYTTSNQSYFLLFAALGTMTYGSREISIHREDIYQRSKLFWEIELITVFSSFIAILGWTILIAFSTQYRVYYIVLTIGIFATLFDITWFYNGIEQFKITVIRNIFFKLTGMFCLFIFIKKKEDLLLYIIITSVTTLLSSLSLWIYLKNYLVKVEFRDLKLKKHFKETLIYFIPTIATSVYTMLDRTLIGAITKDMSQNGYYQQAEKIVNMAKSIVFTAINSVVGVRIAYLYSEGKKEEIQRRINNSINYILFMGLGCCFGIMAIAKTFVPLFLGPGYDEVIPLLYIFCPLIVVIGISNCLGAQYYTPCGKRMLSAKFILVGAVINIILNLFLIPRYKANGAAIASLCAETIITTLYIIFSDGFGRFSFIFISAIKKTIAGILMFFIIFMLNRLDMHPVLLVVIQIILGSLIYLFVLLLLKDSWTQNIISRLLVKIKKVIFKK